MILKRIVIENYRSCLRTSIDLHPNLSVLIGPNGSGKTNILQSIMLLNQMTHGPEHAPGLKSLSATSRLKAAFHSERLNAELTALINSYTNEWNNDVILNSRQKWLFTTEVPRRRRRFFSDIPLGLPFDYMLGRSLIFLTTRQHYRRHYLDRKFPLWARNILENVAKFCRGIRYYGASQFTNPGTAPASFEIEREGKQRSLHRIRGHAKIFYAMYAASRGVPNDQYTRFIEIVGPKGLHLIDDLTFREVKSSSTEYSVRVGGKIERRKRDKLLVVPQFKIGRQTLSPNQLSEGTFKTLSLLFYVITENSTALLIEEPEVCVHHGLLNSILELIKSYSSQKQMIVSTHSDYVLDRVKPDNVYRVMLTKSEGTIVRHIKDTMTSKEFAGLRQYLEQEGNLGEYWREGGLGDRS